MCSKEFYTIQIKSIDKKNIYIDREVKKILKASQGFPGGSVVKNLPANAGDKGLILGSGRSPREGNGAYFSILAWRNPQTEEPGGPQSMESQRQLND